jgi:hypothetical protein
MTIKYKGNGSQIFDREPNLRGDMKHSLAISYAMKKKRKKMATGGEVDEDAPTLPGAESFQAGMRKKTHYADGGKVKTTHTDDLGVGDEMSMFGHNMDVTKEEDRKKYQSIKQISDETNLPKYEEGGEVHDALKNDFVDRIMKKMSPGQEANSTPPIADEMPAEYDDLVLDDNLESTYGDDDNSGDALGNAQEDEDRRDIVSRIMDSRKKKDRNPRPA